MTIYQGFLMDNITYKVVWRGPERETATEALIDASYEQYRREDPGLIAMWEEVKK